MTSEEKRPVETGGFTVRQGGCIVASGSGPYEALLREAGRYASIYLQDGPVTVRIWKDKARTAERQKVDA
jgi:hypothetical protein